MSGITERRLLLDALLRNTTTEDLIHGFVVRSGEITFRFSPEHDVINAVVSIKKGTRTFSNREGSSRFAVREATLSAIMDYFFSEPPNKNDEN